MTTVKVIPDTDRIRYYAQSAINNFETLGAEDAIENAKLEMQAILDYLDEVERFPALSVRLRPERMTKDGRFEVVAVEDGPTGEVSQRMVDAGVHALGGYHPDVSPPELFVRRVFGAMDRVRPRTEP